MHSQSAHRDHRPRRDFLRQVAILSLSPLLSRAAFAEAKTREALSSEVDSIIGKFQSDPTLAESMRNTREPVPKFRFPWSKYPLYAPLVVIPQSRKSTTKISDRATALIIACEVSSQQRYTAAYQSPTWPGYSSGVTIGIGYDIGQVDHSSFASDWTTYVDQATFTTLDTACEVQGVAAKPLAASSAFAKIKINWDTAHSQYLNEDQPGYVAETEDALPNTQELSPDSLGALVSLVYNRGPAFKVAGSRYLEMRSILAHMTNKSFGQIPQDIESMKRLWPLNSGLYARRIAEARLFQLGLQSS